MTNEQYLIAKGWKRSGSFPGDNADQWYDVFDLKYKDIFDIIGKRIPLRVETAVQIQLNRDAEIRDFVDLHRPKLLESK